MHMNICNKMAKTTCNVSCLKSLSTYGPKKTLNVTNGQIQRAGLLLCSFTVNHFMFEPAVRAITPSAICVTLTFK